MEEDSEPEESSRSESDVRVTLPSSWKIFVCCSGLWNFEGVEVREVSPLKSQEMFACSFNCQFPKTVKVL